MAGNEHGRWACGARDDWRVDGVDEAVWEDGRSAAKRGSGLGIVLAIVECGGGWGWGVRWLERQG